jgi:tRNA pseudouridine55 synthase
VPPMYSAKKLGGQKLYELARRGEEVEREPARVCIHEFSAIRPDGEMIKDNMDGTYDFHVHVVCSAGTYIRTLAEDFGKRLGIGAHLAELRRTRVGGITVDRASTLEQIKTSFAEQALGTVLITPSAALSHLPFLHLNADAERKVRHGMGVVVEQADWSDGDRVRMCSVKGDLLAIGEFNNAKRTLHPRVVLAEEARGVGN